MADAPLSYDQAKKQIINARSGMRRDAEAIERLGALVDELEKREVRLVHLETEKKALPAAIADLQVEHERWKGLAGDAEGQHKARMGDYQREVERVEYAIASATQRLGALEQEVQSKEAALETLQAEQKARANETLKDQRRQLDVARDTHATRLAEAEAAHTARIEALEARGQQAENLIRACQGALAKLQPAAAGDDARE